MSEVEEPLIIYPLPNPDYPTTMLSEQITFAAQSPLQTLARSDKSNSVVFIVAGWLVGDQVTFLFCLDLCSKSEYAYFPYYRSQF